MFYRSIGDVPRKRHTLHRDGDGNRLAEELVGEEGFSGNSSLLYHCHSPSELVRVEEILDPRGDLAPNSTVVPVHLRTSDLPPSNDGVLGRRLVAGNDDVRVSVSHATGTSELYRNSTGDELVYVHAGAGRLESSFGTLAVGEGDYVVVPAGVTHRWVVDAPLSLLVLETSGHVRPPRRYLSAAGQFLEHAPYCERDLRAPDGPLVVDDNGEASVLVRNRAGLARHVYRHHPFDVAGWDGCLYPWGFSIRDFEPIVGRLHQPPPVHQTFEGPNFVVCSFVPRLFDFHPNAVKIPYHHANVDSDEVLFYADGDFMSRAGSGIGAGSMTIHPAGFVHGPQPGSWERSIDATATNETAVMLDTFRPLALSDLARAEADPTYLTSWLPRD